MEKLIIIPNDIPFLPTRRTPPKQWKLEAIEKAFLEDRNPELPEVIIFERGEKLIVADGNHRILAAMKYSKPICGIKLSAREEFILRGNPLLQYGKYESYAYQNYGAYAAYIDYCRLVASLRGYSTFSELYKRHMPA